MEKGLESASEGGPLTTRGDIIPLVGGAALSFQRLPVRCGFASLLLVMIAGSAAITPGEDFVEPFAILPRSRLLQSPAANTLYGDEYTSLSVTWPLVSKLIA